MFDADHPATGPIFHAATQPGGAYAVHTHVGSYEATGEILSRLAREIVPIRGFTVDHERPFLATYLTDPNVTREMHWRTDLCVPVIPIRIPLAGNDEGDALTTVGMRTAV